MYFNSIFKRGSLLRLVMLGLCLNLVALHTTAFASSISDISRHASESLFNNNFGITTTVVRGKLLIEWNASSDNGWNVVLSDTAVQNPSDVASIYCAQSFYYPTALNSQQPYYVYVQQILDDNTVSEWSEYQFVSKMTCANKCLFYVELNDACGDGWDDARLLVEQGGYVIDSVTIPNGSELIVPVATCPDSVFFRTVLGAFPDEGSFKIFDENMNLLFTSRRLSAYEDDSLVYVSTGCQDLCMPPTYIDYVLESDNSALLSWEPMGSLNYDLIISDTIISKSNLNVLPYIHQDSCSYLVKQLIPGNIYMAYIRTDCGNGDKSDWNSVTFYMPTDSIVFKPIELDYNDSANIIDRASMMFVNDDEIRPVLAYKFTLSDTAVINSFLSMMDPYTSYPEVAISTDSTFADVDATSFGALELVDTTYYVLVAFDDVHDGSYVMRLEHQKVLPIKDITGSVVEKSVFTSSTPMIYISEYDVVCPANAYRLKITEPNDYIFDGLGEDVSTLSIIVARDSMMDDVVRIFDFSTDVYVQNRQVKTSDDSESCFLSDTTYYVFVVNDLLGSYKMVITPVTSYQTVDYSTVLQPNVVYKGVYHDGDSCVYSGSESYTVNAKGYRVYLNENSKYSFNYETYNRTGSSLNNRITMALLAEDNAVDSMSLPLQDLIYSGYDEVSTLFGVGTLHGFFSPDSTGWYRILIGSSFYSDSVNYQLIIKEYASMTAISFDSLLQSATVLDRVNDLPYTENGAFTVTSTFVIADSLFNENNKGALYAAKAYELLLNSGDSLYVKYTESFDGKAYVYKKQNGQYVFVDSYDDCSDDGIDEKFMLPIETTDTFYVILTSFSSQREGLWFTEMKLNEPIVTGEVSFVPVLVASQQEVSLLKVNASELDVRRELENVRLYLVYYGDTVAEILNNPMWWNVDMSALTATYTCPESYLEDVYDVNVLDESNIVILTISIPVGVENVKSEQADVMLYPNPAADVCYVALNGVKTNMIYVYDLYGRLVMTHTVLTDAVETLPIAGLQAGVYVVRVGNVLKKLVVKE